VVDVVDALLSDVLLSDALLSDALLSDALLSDFVSLLESVFVAGPSVAGLFAPFDFDEYRSEYQPPPLRMKFVPALMSRCAAVFAHLGQRSIGGSVILWISSH
jgi:hypothetical protein